MRNTSAPADGRHRPQRHPGRRWWTPAAAAIAAVGLVTVGVQLQARAASVTPLTAFFVGTDGGLYSFGENSDGVWSSAVLNGNAGIAPKSGPVASTKLSTGMSAAVLVGVNGAVYIGCPTGAAPQQVSAAGTAVSGSQIAAAQTGSVLTAVVVGPANKAGTVSAASVHTSANPLEVVNPCTPVNVVTIPGGTASSSAVSGAAASANAVLSKNTVKPMSPTLPLPPPNATLAAAGLTDGELGVFFVDTTGAVQALWLSAAGGWSSTPLTAAGFSTPGGGIAVTPTSGTDPAAPALSLAYTDRNGNVYVAHPAPGGGQGGATLQLPSTSITHAQPGAALSVAASSAGLIVGYVAVGGYVSRGGVDASGRALPSIALTKAGFAAAGSSAASATSAEWDDFVCGSTGPFHLKHPHGSSDLASIYSAGAAGLTDAATTFSIS